MPRRRLLPFRGMRILAELIFLEFQRTLPAEKEAKASATIPETPALFFFSSHRLPDGPSRHFPTGYVIAALEYPVIIYFWKMKNRMTTGRIARTAPAMI